MKKCARAPWGCKRYHDSDLKVCPKCTESRRRSEKKRKRLMSEKEIQEGFKLCKCCLRIKPQLDFQPLVHRRKKLTTHCTSCRTSKRKTIINPTTQNGKCREFWINWKKQQTCIDCGLTDYRVIEADHVRGTKVYNVGECKWWAWNGGVDAMKEEVKKCESRCSFCHNVKTKERADLKRKLEGKKQNSTETREKRRHEINRLKLNIGECKICHRKVTVQTCNGFDYDHRDEETKIIRISQIVYKKKEEYEKHFKEEIPKCDLLCRNCHRIKTHYN